MTIKTQSIIKNDKTFTLLHIKGFNKDSDPYLLGVALRELAADTKLILQFDQLKMEEFLVNLKSIFKFDVVELHFINCSFPIGTISEFFTIINSTKSIYQEIEFAIRLNVDTHPIFCENLINLKTNALAINFFYKKMPEKDIDLFASSISKNKFVRSFKFDNNMLAKQIPVVVKNLANISLLETIDLSFNSINNSEDIVNLLKLPQLKTLNLSWNNLGKENFAIFCAELSKNKKLETLNLQRISIDSSQAKLLLESLKSTKIKYLDLESNSLNSDHAEALKDFLATSKTIENLNLSFNKMDLPVKRISQIISETSLKHLRLHDCNLSFETCCQLLDGINDNCSLVSLDLSKNNLIHLGNMHSVVKKSQKIVNGPLEQLSFASCETEKSLSLLLNKISFANLRALDFSGAKFSQRDMKELNLLIGRNRKLKTINLEGSEYDTKKMIPIIYSSGLEVDIKLGEKIEQDVSESLNFRDYMIQKRKTVLKSFPMARMLIQILRMKNFAPEIAQLVCKLVLMHEYNEHINSEDVKSVCRIASRPPKIGLNRYTFLNEVCKLNQIKEYEAFQKHNAVKNKSTFLKASQ